MCLHLWKCVTSYKHEIHLVFIGERGKVEKTNASVQPFLTHM